MVASALALIVLASGCLNAGKVLAPLPPGGMHILFIGNSLTYANNLPATLSALALTTGDTIHTTDVSESDFALVDHSHSGQSQAALRLGGWQYVVLQQGPSSVQVNRDTLIMWSAYWSDKAKAVGGKTALYSVWPQYANFGTFARSIESYELAAKAVNGLYLPVGAAWLAAWDKDGTLPLYSGDGLHPSELGTYLAALVMYERFTGKDARLLSGRAVVSGRTLTSVSEATVRLLQTVAHETVAKNVGIGASLLRR